VKVVLGFIAALMLATPVLAAAPGPTAAQLEQFEPVEKVQCSMVNAVMAKIMRKAGDKAHADAYALRALQFMNPNGKASDALALEVEDAANEALAIVEKEAESKVELRSIVVQCDNGASIPSIMNDEKQ
jgi:hypothetical protein